MRAFLPGVQGAKTRRDSLLGIWGRILPPLLSLRRITSSCMSAAAGNSPCFTACPLLCGQVFCMRMFLPGVQGPRHTGLFCMAQRAGFSPRCSACICLASPCMPNFRRKQTVMACRGYLPVTPAHRSAERYAVSESVSRIGFACSFRFEFSLEITSDFHQIPEWNRFRSFYVTT